MSTRTATPEARAAARQAKAITEKVEKLGRQRAEARANRPDLLLDANLGGITYEELEALVGIDASLVAREIAEARERRGLAPRRARRRATAESSS